MRHRNRIITVIAALLALMVVSGCAKTSRVEATGKGSIRGINSIVTAPEINFMIEERTIGAATYKGAAGFAEFDDLSYDFNFDIFLPDQPAPTRLATQFIDVVADIEYTLVLTGSVANPAIMSWEEPDREPDPQAMLGRADVYLANLRSMLGNS